MYAKGFGLWDDQLSLARLRHSFELGSEDKGIRLFTAVSEGICTSLMDPRENLGFLSGFLEADSSPE